jgi:hypothetical protein
MSDFQPDFSFIDSLGGGTAAQPPASTPTQDAAAQHLELPYIGMGDLRANESAGIPAPTKAPDYGQVPATSGDFQPDFSFIDSLGQAQPATPSPTSGVAPDPPWWQDVKNTLGTVFNIPDAHSLIPANSVLNQPLQQVAGKWPQAAGIGIAKGVEDLARTAATSVPTSEFLTWQQKWQKVHPNGMLPPLTSQVGQELLKEDIDAGRIDPPPTNLTYGSALDTAYTKGVEDPLKKKLGVTGTPGENLAYGFGEFVAPSLAGDALLGGTGLETSAADSMQGLIPRAATRAAESVPRAATQWGLMEETKPANERTPLLSWLGQFAGMDIATHDILPAIFKQMKAKIPDATPDMPEPYQPVPSSFTSQQPALPAGQELPALMAGQTPDALTGQTTIPGEGGFDQANAKTPQTYAVTSNPGTRALQRLQDGLETLQNYVQHNDVLATYPPGTTIDQAWDDLGQKTGVNIKQLVADYDKTQEPKDLHGERLVGARPPLSDAKIKRPDWLTPEQPKPATRTPGELNAARNALKRYREVPINLVKKVWDAFPELQQEYPNAGKFLDKQAQEHSVPATFAETATKVHTPSELKSARNILSQHKTINNPVITSRVWNNFPELQSEFPEVSKGVDVQKARDVLKRNQDLGHWTKSGRAAWNDYPELQQEFPDLDKRLNSQAAERTTTQGTLQDQQAKSQQAATPKKSRFSQSTRSWADTQEQAARETLQKLQQQHKQGTERLGAGLDPEYMKAYAQLGASKIARGVANFADWAQEMGSDLGDSAKPYLKQIFQEANKLVNAKEDEARSYKRQYVDDSEFKINVDPKDTYGGTTAKDIQTEFTGRVARDRLQGAILNDQIKTLIPDKNERAAAQIYLDFGGNKQAIAEWIADEDPTIDQTIPNLDITYRDALQKALNLSDGGKKGVDILKRYYAEAGGHAMETGATQDIRANYANRKWEQRETGGAYVRPRWMETEKGKSIIGELSDTIRSKQKFDSTDRAQVEDVLKKYGVSKKQMPKRFSDIKNLLYNEGDAATPTNSAGKIQGGQYESNTLNTFTRHSKPREFPTTMHGVKSGFTPVTMDAGDLAQMHVGEMSTVNNMRLLGDSLVKNKLAETISGDAELSKDWKTVMSFGGKRIVAPTRLADALKAITDVYRPSEIAKTYNKLQGLLKTGKVAFGGFHALNMAKSLLYSSKMGFDFVKNIPKINEMVKDGTFNDVQLKWVRQGLVTARVDRIADIGDEFSKGDDFLSKMTNLPGIKQFFEGAEAINHQVFYNMQTWGKTLDAEFKLDDWAGKHTGATEEETTEAMREISRFENANAGGMNWGALGVTPTVRNAMKMGTLAPDWLVSKIMLGKYALTDSGLTGQYARMRIGTAFVAGAAMTEIYSKLTTGHFTDKNQPGKEGQVEIAPNVWFSFFPAEVDDFLQVVGNTVKGGLEDAVVQYALNKMAPIPKTFGDLAQDESMYYKSGFKTATEKSAQTTAEDLAPLPMGWMNDFENWMKQAQGKKPATTLGGNIAAATGIGSYSAPAGQTGSVFDKQGPVNQGNWLHTLTMSPQERAEQDIMNRITAADSADKQNITQLQETLGKTLLGAPTAGRSELDPIFDKYGIAKDYKTRKQIYSSVVAKLKARQAAPLVSKFNSLAVRDRGVFLRSLSQEDKQLLIVALAQVNQKEAQKVEATH